LKISTSSTWAGKKDSIKWLCLLQTPFCYNSSIILNGWTPFLKKIECQSNIPKETCLGNWRTKIMRKTTVPSSGKEKMSLSFNLITFTQKMFCFLLVFFMSSIIERERKFANKSQIEIEKLLTFRRKRKKNLFCLYNKLMIIKMRKHATSSCFLFVCAINNLIGIDRNLITLT
jgi:hypothetical protein